MIHTLKCPSCSAPLDYEDESDKASIRCPFCENRVVVPDSMRRTGPQVHVHSFSTGRRPPVIKVHPVATLVIVGGILAVVGAIIYSVTRTIANVASAVPSVPSAPRPALPVPPRPEPKPKPAGFASTVMEFGSEGIGPGMFKDARSIAVDGEGRIYVGEYTGGRVQVFDAAGKFLTQWMVDPKMPLRDLAADRRGTVYVAQSGKIHRYEGPTGRPLGEMQHPHAGFDSLFTTPDGGLLAAAYRGGQDDIVRFDSSGNATKTIRKAFSDYNDHTEMDMNVAEDGEGNVYVLGFFNSAVLKFSPQGRFVNKFGGQGEEPGLFRSPRSIAVDGLGRVYVSDTKGIQVFDPNGRYLDVFEPANVTFGMVFNDKNELFIAARTKVIKCALNNKK